MTKKKHPGAILSDTIAKTVNVRYCSGHMGDWPADDGKMIQKNKTSRFICTPCLKRTKKPRRVA